MYDWITLLSHIQGGRNKTDRPLCNNTRAWKRGESVAVRLHNTDVVTIHPDNTRELSSGGYHTITTLDRIRTYGSRHVHSVRGEWFITGCPSADDPEPPHRRRTIPKPYMVADPGDEPVKSPDGCIAGTREEYVVERHETVYGSRDDPARVFISKRHPYGSERFSVRVAHVAENHATVWLDHAHRPWCEPSKPRETYKECPHCKAFNDRLLVWERQMRGMWEHPNGVGGSKGWLQMQELLADYGSREGWHEAYLTDLRDTREAQRLYREWRERNWVPWDVGRECVDPDGYVQDHVASAWRTHVRRRQIADAREAARAKAFKQSARTAVRERNKRRPNLSLLKSAINEGAEVAA